MVNDRTINKQRLMGTSETKYKKQIRDDAKFIGAGGACDDDGARTFSPEKKDGARIFLPEQKDEETFSAEKKMRGKELFSKKKKNKRKEKKTMAFLTIKKDGAKAFLAN